MLSFSMWVMMFAQFFVIYAYKCYVVSVILGILWTRSRYKRDPLDLDLSGSHGVSLYVSSFQRTCFFMSLNVLKCYRIQELPKRINLQQEVLPTELSQDLETKSRIMKMLLRQWHTILTLINTLRTDWWKSDNREPWDFHLSLGVHDIATREQN